MEKSKDIKNGLDIKLEDVIKLFSSGVKKTVDFILEYWKDIINNWFDADFIASLNRAWISPNNITTFRIFSLVIWTIIYYLWNPILGLSAMTWSCVLDVVDWKLARRFKQKSKEWETFDAWLDKWTDMSLTTISTIELVNSLSNNLAVINWIFWSLKSYYHWKSQFREWRPSLDEQIDMTAQCILKDEDTQYIGKTSSWAATKYWKYKTALQFTSSLWILWTSEVDKLINMWIWKDVLDVIFVALSWVSIILAQKSINWGNKKS